MGETFPRSMRQRRTAEGGSRIERAFPGGSVALWLTAVALGAAVGGSTVAGVVEYESLPSQQVWVVTCEFVAIAGVAYRGTASGYLVPSYGSTPAYCTSQRVASGSVVSLPLFLHNNDPSQDHRILGLTAQSPFRLVNASPGPPIVIPAGGNLTFNLAVLAPDRGGTYYPAVEVTAD